MPGRRVCGASYAEGIRLCQHEKLPLRPPMSGATFAPLPPRRHRMQKPTDAAYHSMVKKPDFRKPDPAKRRGPSRDEPESGWRPEAASGNPFDEGKPERQHDAPRAEFQAPCR